MLNRPSLAVFILALVGLTLCSLAQRNAPRKVAKVNWQAGQMAQVQLLVRDKDGVLGPYDALFIVTGSDGKEWKASKHTDRGEAGEASVFFPEDFHLAAAPTGSYAWKCLVKGDAIIEGQFEYVQNNAVTKATADQLELKFR